MAILRHTVVFILLGMMCLTTYGQEPELEEEVAQERQFTIDTPITIDLEKEEEDKRVEPQKKKRKKKVYFGFKTKKGFTRTGYGDNTVLELFYYLKEYQEPDLYVQKIHWYDFKRKQIRTTKRINKEYGVILHGPYKKTRGDVVLEEGVYFVGTKHGRWLHYDRNDLLIDKRKYYKGWPRESLVRYYDEERTKLKEVIPVVFGKKKGTYYYFFENGTVAVRGTYENDSKVGLWTEYYSARGRRKKEIKYPDDPWDKAGRPFISKEWNQSGRVVYDYAFRRRNSS